MATRDVSARLSLKDRLKFSRELGTAGDDLDRFGRKGSQAKHLGGFTKSIGHIGVALGTMGVAAGVAGLALGGKFVTDARESAKVSAITAAQIKATGGAAGLTAKQVGGLATSISNKTGIDDEAIQANENVLLSFKKVHDQVGKGNKIFSRATGLAQDMATVMKTDAKSSTMQLGKALQDPVKGITALGRAGVSFTVKQKAQIANFVKTGHLLKAQKIILGEVQGEFGGAAAAAATPMDKLKVSVGNLSEQVGGYLIPYVDRFSTWATTKGLPAIRGFMTGMQDGTGAGGKFVAKARQLVEVGKKVVHFLINSGKWIKKNSDWLLPLVGGLAAAVGVYKGIVAVTKAWTAVQVIFKGIVAVTKAWTAVQVIFNGVMGMNPIGLVVAAVVGLGVAVVLAYKKSETFRDIVNGAFRAVGGFVLTVVDKILGAIQGFMEGLGHLPGKLGAPFRAAADKIQGARDKIAGLKTDLATFGKPKVEVLVDLVAKLNSKGRATGQHFSVDGVGSGMTRAGGGPVRKGFPYVVGEHHAELFVPGQNGRINPSLSMPSMPTFTGGVRGGDGAAGGLLVHTQLIVDSKVLAESTDRVVASTRARRR